MDRIDAMRAFVRLIELGSFTRVGEELRVKQSTVSKWIAALEEHFGATLVVRTSRSMHVTDAGELFYARCQEMLAAWENTEAELRRRAPELRGRLKVSMPAVFGRRFVLPHLPRFAHEHPELELELLFDDRYIDLIADGFDVAIRVGLPRDSSLLSRNLARSRRYVVASPTYLEQHGSPRTPADLASHACLLHTSATGIWRFERDGKTHPARVRGPYTANQSEAMLDFARAGLGVALLASWLVRDDLESGALTALLPDYTLPPAPVQALIAPSPHTPARVRAFVDFLAEALSGLP